MNQCIFIISLSGAGKNTASKIFENFDFKYIENLPYELFDSFHTYVINELEEKSFAVNFLIEENTVDKLMKKIITLIKDEPRKYKLLYLGAETRVLLNRHELSRQKHPLFSKLALPDAIEEEKKLLNQFKINSTFKIDTSELNVNELKNQIRKQVITSSNDRINIKIYSFGYKYGMPMSIDYVFDVRFLPNPFYNDNLKNKTGLDKEVYDYVMNNKDAIDFSKKVKELLDFTFEKIITEGRSEIDIAFGCSGGQHRSTSIAEYFAKIYSEKYNVITIHKEQSKWRK